MPRDPIDSNMSHILSQGCRLTANPSASKFCYWHHMFIVYCRIIYSQHRLSERCVLAASFLREGKCYGTDTIA
jgi:hypothetical protein